jgi:hypothetical protein
MRKSDGFSRFSLQTIILLTIAVYLYVFLVYTKQKKRARMQESRVLYHLASQRMTPQWVNGGREFCGGCILNEKISHIRPQRNMGYIHLVGLDILAEWLHNIYV